MNFSTRSWRGIKTPLFARLAGPNRGYISRRIYFSAQAPMKMTMIIISSSFQGDRIWSDWFCFLTVSLHWSFLLEPSCHCILCVRDCIKKRTQPRHTYMFHCKSGNKWDKWNCASAVLEEKLKEIERNCNAKKNGWRWIILHGKFFYIFKYNDFPFRFG